MTVSINELTDIYKNKIIKFIMQGSYAITIYFTDGTFLEITSDNCKLQWVKGEVKGDNDEYGIKIRSCF